MNRSKILDIVSFAGSAASIASLMWMDSVWNIPKIILSISLFIVFVTSAYITFFKKDTLVFKEQAKINDFMKKWIKTPGVVKILSRDLSWVDKEVMEIIQTKKDDLYLYVEAENDVVKNILQVNNECKIYYYGEYGFSPDSRYTIIHANKVDRQIAIALQERKDHKKLVHEIYISKENAYDKKMLGLATDLMNCIECMERKSE